MSATTESRKSHKALSDPTALAARALARAHIIGTLPAGVHLRMQEVLLVIGVSKATWYDGMERGIYPQPVRIGVGSVAWRAADILALLKKIEAGKLLEGAV